MKNVKLSLSLLLAVAVGASAFPAYAMEQGSVTINKELADKLADKNITVETFAGFLKDAGADIPVISGLLEHGFSKKQATELFFVAQQELQDKTSQNIQGNSYLRAKSQIAQFLKNAGFVDMEQLKKLQTPVNITQPVSFNDVPAATKVTQPPVEPAIKQVDTTASKALQPASSIPAPITNQSLLDIPISQTDISKLPAPIQPQQVKTPAPVVTQVENVQPQSVKQTNFAKQTEVPAKATTPVSTPAPKVTSAPAVQPAQAQQPKQGVLGAIKNFGNSVKQNFGEAVDTLTGKKAEQEAQQQEARQRAETLQKVQAVGLEKLNTALGIDLSNYYPQTTELFKHMLAKSYPVKSIIQHIAGLRTMSPKGSDVATALNAIENSVKQHGIAQARDILIQYFDECCKMGKQNAKAQADGFVAEMLNKIPTKASQPAIKQTGDTALKQAQTPAKTTQQPASNDVPAATKVTQLPVDPAVKKAVINNEPAVKQPEAPKATAPATKQVDQTPSKATQPASKDTTVAAKATQSPVDPAVKGTQVPVDQQPAAGNNNNNAGQQIPALHADIQQILDTKKITIEQLTQDLQNAGFVQGDIDDIKANGLGNIVAYANELAALNKQKNTNAYKPFIDKVNELNAVITKKSSKFTLRNALILGGLGGAAVLTAGVIYKVIEYLRGANIKKTAAALNELEQLIQDANSVELLAEQYPFIEKQLTALDADAKSALNALVERQETDSILAAIAAHKEKLAALQKQSIVKRIASGIKHDAKRVQSFFASKKQVPAAA